MSKEFINVKSICSIEWLNNVKIWCATNLDNLGKVYSKNLLLTDVSFDAELGVLSGVIDSLYLTTEEALKRLTEASMDVLGGSLSLTSFGELKVLQDDKGNLIERANKLLLTASDSGYKIQQVI